MNKIEDEFLAKFRIAYTMQFNILPQLHQNRLHGVSDFTEKMSLKTAFAIEKKRWQKQIIDTCLIDRESFEKEVARKEKKVIRATFFVKKYFDEANLIAGFKPVPDIMKKIGLIIDDSPRHLKIIYRQKKGDTATKIEIFDSCKELLNNYFEKIVEQKTKKKNKKFCECGCELKKSIEWQMWYCENCKQGFKE